jgi:hypothetical protein
VRKITHILLFVFISFGAFSQTNSIFHIDSLDLAKGSSNSDYGVLLDSCWKYQKGDNVNWAKPDFNDYTWKFIAPNLDFTTFPENTFETIGWFRIHIDVDTALVDKTLALMITQSGASEIYLDGKLIHSFGKINTIDVSKESRFDPQLVPVDIRFEKTRQHVLAVRYADARALNDFKNKESNSAGFDMKIGNLRESIFAKYQNSNTNTGIFVLMFFLFYRANKSNLYYSIFAGAFGTVFLCITIQKAWLFPDFETSTSNFISYLPDFYIPALLAMLYSIFYKKISKLFIIWLIIFALDFIFKFLHINIPYASIVLNILFAAESLRIIIMALYRKKEGSGIIGTGVIVTLTFFILFFILAADGNANFYADGWKE